MKFIKSENKIYSMNNNGKIVAEITFKAQKNNIYNIEHTFVDESLRGQGVAKQLVEMAIEEIKKRNGKVEATCSYAKHYLEKNKIAKEDLCSEQN